MSTSFLDALTEHFKPHQPRWSTPGQMAQELDPRTVQTPALDLIDDALVRAFNTPDSRLIISMPPQEGKALALDTPIPTPTGWTTMGDLKPGDKVLGRNGHPCTVTWKSQVWDNHDCYTVITGDGEHIVANAAHEWVGKLDRRRSERIIETTLLAKKRSKNAQLPGAEPLELPEADLPVDPYVLGAWLGDGHTKAAMMTVHPDDYEILENFVNAGYPVRKAMGKYAWHITEGGTTKISKFRKDLTNAGVWGNKHVPAAYLRASRSQRLALLQGLIDTDGHVTAKGQVEFVSTTRSLAEAVQELVYSLGAKAALSEHDATLNGRYIGKKYRVYFYLANAARLARKAERCKESSVAGVRYVKAEPVDSVPTVCIEVDSPDHTYLAGRTMLVTHNSQRASRRFPEWALQQNPETRIAIASYEANIARRWGRAIRDDIKQNSEAFGVRVRDDLSAQHEWQLAGHEGGVFTAGIGGALTGRPVDMLIVDDPVKNRADAESPTMRENAKGWWSDVALTRLAPGAPVVIILTRWHDDDLAGWLMKTQPGTWEFLRIPAQADHRPELGETDPLGREPGEFMVSARGRSTQQWENRKRESSPKTWAALYQGVPSPDEGGIFPGEFETYDQPLWQQQPDGARHVPGVGREDHELVQSWDFTFSNTEGSDYVVGQVWLRVGSQAYLLDMVRERMTFPQMCDAVRAMTAKWPQAQTTFVEAKASGSQVIDMLRRSEPNAFIPINPTESKVARANAVSPFAWSKNIVLPTASLLPNVGELLEELKLFPASSHDDTVDALTQAISQLLLYRIDDMSGEDYELFEDFTISDY